MNWTGGRLCRSRNANSSVSAKQKNHFAKVRANLQSARSSSPKRRPFNLSHWRPDYEITHISPLGTRQPHGLSQHQTILDDFEYVRPLVKKLHTINQRNENYKRKRPPMEHSVQHSKTEESGGRAMCPIIISSRPSSASSAESPAPAIATNKDRLQFDNLGASGLTSIEAKRLRLLQMDDWVGVERRHSKPAHITFTEAEDRDMIGKRRHMKKSHHVTRDVTHRPTRRKLYLEQPRSLDALSQDFGVSQMSIRIGSAVDRSQASASSGEMLFDCEVQEHKPKKLPAAPVIQPGQLGPPPVSDQTHRGMCASSALGDDLPSINPFFQPEDMRFLPQSVHRNIGTPSGSIDDRPSFGFVSRLPGDDPPKHNWLKVPIIDKDKSETNQEMEPSLPLEHERIQKEQGFRLVFENTPQPSSSRWTKSDPIVRDFFANDGPPLAPWKMSPLLREHISTPDGDAEADGSSFESLGSSGNATNQNSRNHAPTGREQQKEKTNRFEGEVDPVVNSKSSQICFEEMQPPARRKSPDGNKLQPNQEEESIWRSFTIKDDIEDTKSFKARPTSNNTGEELTANQHTNHNTQWSVPKTKSPSPIDEEEQIWRAFIFSDGNNPTNEWTLESPLPVIQSSTPSNPVQTQLSMIAEVFTSPIKQNPHLEEASLPVSPSEISGQLKQGLSERPDSATSHSSDILAGISSPTVYLLGSSAGVTAQSETAERSDEESTAARRTRDFTFTPWTVPTVAASDESQNEHRQHSSVSAQAPTIIRSSSNPQTPVLSSNTHSNPLPRSSSSLIAAPPSSTPLSSSSDELHGTSLRPVATLLSPKSGSRVVFMPPKRYTAPRATEAENRIAFGRGLRGRKRQVGGKAKGKGKERERGRADGDGEGCSDEIVDE